MAFPTTEMAGYSDLKDRIALALSRYQEQTWLDFKESQPWSELKWRLLKTIMGMANLRDGGLILIGVSERNDTWTPTGIDPKDLGTFDNDEIIDQLEKYASPRVQLAIVLHDHDDGNRFLVFHVGQFDDCPILCRNNSPDGVKPNDRLASGDIYVRPTTGRPRTIKANDARLVHDLLELAAEFRARRMLEIARRVGLVPAESTASQYDAELPAILRGDQ